MPRCDAPRSTPAGSALWGRTACSCGACRERGAAGSHQPCPARLLLQPWSSVSLASLLPEFDAPTLAQSSAPLGRSNYRPAPRHLPPRLQPPAPRGLGPAVSWPESRAEAQAVHAPRAGAAIRPGLFAARWSPQSATRPADRPAGRHAQPLPRRGLQSAATGRPSRLPAPACPRRHGRDAPTRRM